MLRRILKIIALPLGVLGVFALLYAVWVVLDLPPEQTIIEIAKPYLDRYGAALVLACAYHRRPAADRLVFSRHPGGHLRLRGGRAGCGASRRSSPPRPASACSPPT